jgi:hypothetical protein
MKYIFDHFKINLNIYYYNQQKNRKPRTPGIPKRSPIQVLTGLDVA